MREVVRLALTVLGERDLEEILKTVVGAVRYHQLYCHVSTVFESLLPCSCLTSEKGESGVISTLD